MLRAEGPTAVVQMDVLVAQKVILNLNLPSFKPLRQQEVSVVRIPHQQDPPSPPSMFQ